MEASHFDQKKAYASVDRHQLQDFDPYIYRTRDMGKTWTRITRGLPAGVYVHTVKEDPVRAGLVFCGTERGVYVSLDDGDTWQPLRINMPVTSMRDIEIYGNDLIVATHGRGFWVMDDISPLRQINDSVVRSDAYLFKPADIVDTMPTSDNGTPLQKDEPQAPNPPNGAAIDFYIGKSITGPVTLEILDASGATIHSYTTAPSPQPEQPTGRPGRRGGIPSVSPLWQTPPEPLSASPGMHRVFWDPLTRPLVDSANPGGFRRSEGTRVSGTFTARLTANGKSYARTFSVKPDPRRRETSG
jgi:hypothetical protein